MHRPLVTVTGAATAHGTVAASSSFTASQRSWQNALGRVGPALRAAWFVCLLAATALAGAAPGVIDVR